MFFSRFKGIQTKILTVVLGSVFLSILTSAVISIYSSRNALSFLSMKQLISIRETKKAQVEDQFSTYRKQVKTLSENLMIVEAMKGFKETFRNFRSENAIDSMQLDLMRQGLKTYYNGDFSQEFQNRNGESPDSIVSTFGALDDDAIALQSHFIHKNPHPLGNKGLMINPGDGSSYSSLHEQYHPVIHKYLDAFGYYDIFLVDSETGDIVYSVFKELDFATSLMNGPYSRTNFGEVFQAANRSNDPDFVRLADFAPYFPSYNDAASFIASPIFDQGKKIGVLIFQMPIEEINKTMTNSQNWKGAGLGDSGETYLIGEDFTMRNSSRFLIEDPQSYFEQVANFGLNPAEVDKIRKKKSSILLQRVKTEGTEAALRGITGEQIFEDYRGVRVLSAFAPLQIENVQWVIMSEIDEAEIINAKLSEQALSLNDLIFISSAFILLIAGAIGFWVTRSIIRLLTNLVNNLNRSADQLATASREISSSSQQLSEGATEQAASLEETSSSMEEIASQTRANASNASSVSTTMEGISSTVKLSADHAKSAADLSEDARDSAKDGAEAMLTITGAMKEIREESERVVDFLGAINEITNQTKMLATNAAIEAARAGEQGKGFAVVADEVSKLAENSKKAAKEIGTLIKESAIKAKNGNEMAERGQVLLKTILDKSNKVAVLVNEIADSAQAEAEQMKEAEHLVEEIKNASNEQSTGVDQITHAIVDMDKVTQSNAANAEETASSSEALSQQAFLLKELVQEISVHVGLKQAPTTPDDPNQALLPGQWKA